jgi:dCMP deaminase
MQKDKQKKAYMKTAELYASMSNGIRAKVGCVIVTKTGVILPGYNGTPSGFDNSLEEVDPETGELITKPTVIHAELNCVLKAAKEGISLRDSEVYVTHSCCQSCAAMLVQAGVKKVHYRDIYRDTKGLQVLEEGAIVTERLE